MKRRPKISSHESQTIRRIAPEIRLDFGYRARIRNPSPPAQIKIYKSARRSSDGYRK